MAINTWATATLDPAAASKPDRADHRNVTQFAGADGASLTIAIDSAVVTRMTLFDSLVASIRAAYAGRLPP